MVKRKVIHKITIKTDWGFTIIIFVLCNLFAAVFIIPLSFIFHIFFQQTWSLIVSTVLATVGMCIINFLNKDTFFDNTYERVEHIIK